ncbi:hypothetical protein [Mesorhizobium abyssinicae]|uniref:hypothetical protein n=1 Tax=Mesorhizobium abyssinicae TaxID=1209958 RepID=UPI003CEC44E4
MQDGIAAGGDPIGGFLRGQLMNMDEMTLGRCALALEGFAVFEGVERVARTVTIDDDEADGLSDLRA